MPQINVLTAGNNVENLRAFWITVPNAQGGGPRWGENGLAWNATANVSAGTYNAGISIAGIQNPLAFQIVIPQQAAFEVPSPGDNEIIVEVEQHENGSTVSINVNN